MRPHSSRSAHAVQVFVWLLGAVLAAQIVLLAGCGPRHGANGGSGVDVEVRGQVDMGVEAGRGIR